MRGIHRSTCPYDCPDACGLLVEADGARVLSVRGDPEHPYSRGTLCAKMNRYGETVHAPSRLTTPLVRDGPKGSGAFRRSAWEEAVSLVASRWKTIVERHGAEAILPYSYAGTMGLVQRNAGHAFFHALGASRLARTICTPAKDAGWKAVMGDTLGLDPDDAVESDLVVLWGVDAVATNVHFLARARTARARGARVFLVDTYLTPTARVADRAFVVRPGSDGALALGVMHVLQREGLVDREFVARHVTGADELAREVLPEWTPERTASVTGLAPQDVIDLGTALGRARAPFLRIGGGLSRYANGAMTVRTIVCIPALLGSWTRRGGGAYCKSSGGQAFDLAALHREDLQPAPTRVVNMNQLGHALTQLEGPRVMSLYVYSSNPAAVAPDQNAVLAGLAREDLFTVVHERFLTDTARLADVVLPATTSVEHADLYCSYGHYAVQRARAAIPPVGESRSNWDVFRSLAAAMGLDHPMFRSSTDDLVDALLERPSPLRAGLDRAALDEGRAVLLRRPAGLDVRTPSGRIEILNPRLAERLPRFLPTYVDAERAGTSPTSAAGPPRFPLRLVTAPSPYGLNSSFVQERDDLRRKAGRMMLRMNPDDAAARDIQDRTVAHAWNDRGEVAFEIEVTADVPRGVVVAPGVRRLDDAPGERTVNALTSQRLTDQGAGSTFYDNAVEVRKAPAG